MGKQFPQKKEKGRLNQLGFLGDNSGAGSSGSNCGGIGLGSAAVQDFSAANILKQLKHLMVAL